MPCGLVILQQRKDHRKIAKMLTDTKPAERERNKFKNGLFAASRPLFDREEQTPNYTPNSD
jgi:hypothetical protein